ncbi:MAG: 2-nitropropane dioxygenase family protein [Herbaspirillum sp.]|nr:2-nitropropane dioxygenase family protein [Herbaspirillum sp.]
MKKTAFQLAVGIEHPIVQGPMNGGSPPELAAAASNAGALGSCAAALLSPSSIIDTARTLRTLTDKPFNMNLFLLEPVAFDVNIAHVQSLLQPFRDELGLAPLPVPEKFAEDCRDQIAALLEAAPPVASFTFGILSADVVQQFKKAGSQVMGTATTVAEAQAWEQAGADYVCVLGSEAGGHRATFLGDFEQSCIGLMALIPQVAASVRIPIVAAGGMMNGRGIAAALLLGAQAAQLGTAFLNCPESGIASAWRTQLTQARDDSTRLTRTFTGRPARGIVNDFMEKMRPFEALMPPYPIQNTLTANMRQTAAKQDRPEFMSLWAGQGVSMSRPMPTAQLVQTLANELTQAFNSIQQLSV